MSSLGSSLSSRQHHPELPASYWPAPAALLSHESLDWRGSLLCFYLFLFYVPLKESDGRSDGDAPMFCHTRKNKATDPLTMDRSENPDWLLNSCHGAKQAGNKLFAASNIRPWILHMTECFIFLLEVKVLSFWHHCFLIHIYFWNIATVLQDEYSTSFPFFPSLRKIWKMRQR